MMLHVMSQGTALLQIYPLEKQYRWISPIVNLWRHVTFQNISWPMEPCHDSIIL